MMTTLHVYFRPKIQDYKVKVKISDISLLISGEIFVVLTSVHDEMYFPLLWCFELFALLELGRATATAYNTNTARLGGPENAIAPSAQT